MLRELNITHSIIQLEKETLFTSISFFKLRIKRKRLLRFQRKIRSLLYLMSKDYLLFTDRDALNDIAYVVGAHLWITARDAVDHIHAFDDLPENGVAAV